MKPVQNIVLTGFRLPMNRGTQLIAIMNLSMKVGQSSKNKKFILKRGLL
jgi:hypothetical protein